MANRDNNDDKKDSTLCAKDNDEFSPNDGSSIRELMNINIELLNTSQSLLRESARDRMPSKATIVSSIEILNKLNFVLQGKTTKWAADMDVLQQIRQNVVLCSNDKCFRCNKGKEMRRRYIGEILTNNGPSVCLSFCQGRGGY